MRATDPLLPPVRNVYVPGASECGQFREDHPVIRLIHQCLHNLPARRPGIRNVIRLLEEARATLRSEDCERNKVLLLRALQTQPRNKVIQHKLCEYSIFKVCITFAEF